MAAPTFRPAAAHRLHHRADPAIVGSARRIQALVAGLDAQERNHAVRDNADFRLAGQRDGVLRSQGMLGQWRRARQQRREDRVASTCQSAAAVRNFLVLSAKRRILKSGIVGLCRINLRNG